MRGRRPPPLFAFLLSSPRQPLNVFPCCRLSSPVSLCAKDYITVSQLSQIFGMQRIDPTSSSSLPSFQLATSETTFSCHSTPPTFPSAQVCCTSSPHPFLFLSLARTLQLHILFLLPRICFMLLSLMQLLNCSLPSFPLCGLAAVSSPQSQPELHRNVMAPINLERWYQDIMAAVEPPSCPPPLPAKSFSARRHGQVNDSTLCPSPSYCLGLLNAVSSFTRRPEYQCLNRRVCNT